MREVAVIGVGSTILGKFPEKLPKDMGIEAVLAAITHAGISPREIQFACCATVFGGMVIGQRILNEVGINRIEVVNVENASAGGASAFREVWHRIATDHYDIGLAIGVESITTSPVFGKLLPPETGDIWGMLGGNAVSGFALRMRRHMERYGTTLEQIAKVAVKNRRNGCLNPYVQSKKVFSIEDVLNSRMISDPITMLMCCPNTDGAAAAILCSIDVARRYTSKPISVAASVQRMGIHESLIEDFATLETAITTAKEAYEMAGLGPEDIDLVETHDAFAYEEISHCEELGFCPLGEGGRLIDEGVTEIGGRIPFSPSGGLQAKGHPFSCTGMQQIAEIVWHLRGEAGERQVSGAKAGLAHLMGGEVANLEAGVATVHILKR